MTTEVRCRQIEFGERNALHLIEPDARKVLGKHGRVANEDD